LGWILSDAPVCADWFLGSDHNFAVERSAAPAGRAAGSGNLCSDPENA
jgi:hypothetical protein